MWKHYDVETGSLLNFEQNLMINSGKFPTLGTEGINSLL